MSPILCIHRDPTHTNQSLSADQADSAGYVAMCSGTSETYGHLEPHLPKKLERESQGGTFRVCWQPLERWACPLRKQNFIYLFPSRTVLVTESR